LRIVLVEDWWQAQSGSYSITRAAEQLVAFQTVTEDPIPCHSHRYLLAKTYFDAREYQRASFILQNEKDHQSLFLSGYSTYLHVQSQQQYLNPSSITGMGAQVPKDLKSLCVELDNIHNKDAFLLYLSGIVRIKLKRVSEGKEALIQSLIIYPYNWSAWLELGTTIDNVEAVSMLLTNSWTRC
jgi:anaphase-promoting complex subunit 8